MAQGSKGGNGLPRSIKAAKKISGFAGNLFYCSGFLFIEFTSQIGLHEYADLVLRQIFA